MPLYSNDIKWIIVYIPSELSHSSYLITSIQEFSKKNQIPLIYNSNPFSSKGRIEVSGEELINTTHSYLKVVFVRLNLKDKSSKLLAFDFHDSHSFFSLKALSKADFYFKRTYIEEDIGIISEKYNMKIFPLGIPFMVRPDEILPYQKLMLSFYSKRLKSALRLDRDLFGRFRSGFVKANDDWISFYKTRTLSDFENYNAPKNLETIFYQKRFFPNENSEDTKAVHQQRVAIVRLLKEEFLKNFKGGIKDDQNLPLEYKDCASSIKGSQQEFLKIVKESGICIYTRGLTNSIGWTLPEFMSQGKAIIAERQNVVFPIALKHNVHLLYFDNTEELKSQIQYLLDNPSEIRRLSKNVRQYYESNISPNIFFESILKQIHA